MEALAKKKRLDQIPQEIAAERRRLISLALEDKGVEKAMQEGRLRADDVVESVEISLSQSLAVTESLAAISGMRKAKERFERRRWLSTLLTWLGDRPLSISVLVLLVAFVVGLVFAGEEGIRWYEGVAFTGFFGVVAVLVLNLLMYFLRRGLDAAGEHGAQTRQAFTELEQRMVEGTILPEVRARIKDPPFSARLEPIDTRGLGSLFDPRYEVPVKATEDLENILEALEAGSVGIAGSRGVGKSTLIRAACSGGIDTGETDERKAQRGMLVSAPVRYEAQDFVRFLFAKLCLSVLSVPGSEVEDVGAAYGPFGFLQESVGVLSAAIFGGPSRPPPDNSPVAIEARRCLRHLRYLETLSQDWSGEVGAKGTKLGLKRGVSRAEQAWTLPELIERYRRFLGLLTEDGPIVIGIDELDKMSDVDEARRFLNDMKSLFDQSKVYYLVSISEDALSDFERRGQPIRDVFDSVFSDVLHVDYLGQEESTLILRRRAIGVPPPWPALFHCLSGGLPRESIRVARRASRIAAESSPELGAVTMKLIDERARAHEHAAAVIAQRHVGPNGTQPLLSWLRELPRIAPNHRPAGKTAIDVAREALLKRMEVEGVMSELRGHDQPGDRKAETLGCVVMELAASSHHSLACLEFFADLNEERFAQACAPRADDLIDIELLARGHQDLSASPALSWQAVAEFRERLRFDPYPYPAVAPAGSVSPVDDLRHPVLGAADRDALSLSELD